MKTKNKIIILCLVAVVLIVAALFGDRLLSREYLHEIKYDDLMTKIENKEDIILCISQTTCNHCQSYKPKLARVGKKYKVDIYYIDVDLLNQEERQELNKKVSISGGTPATAFIKNGEEKTAANRINGNVSTDKIIEKFKKQGYIK